MSWADERIKRGKRIGIPILLSLFHDHAGSVPSCSYMSQITNLMISCHCGLYPWDYEPRQSLPTFRCLCQMFCHGNKKNIPVSIWNILVLFDVKSQNPHALIPLGNLQWWSPGMFHTNRLLGLPCSSLSLVKIFLISFLLLNNISAATKLNQLHSNPRVLVQDALETF